MPNHSVSACGVLSACRVNSHVILVLSADIYIVNSLTVCMFRMVINNKAGQPKQMREQNQANPPFLMLSSLCALLGYYLEEVLLLVTARRK